MITNNEQLKVVAAILDLYKDKSHWTQGVLARDEYRKECDVHNSYAYCFCLEGAVVKCSPDYIIARAVLQTMRAQLSVTRDSSSLWLFNDKSSYEEVMDFVLHVKSYLSLRLEERLVP